MNEKNNHLWLNEYFERYNESIFDNAIYDDLIRIRNIWEETKKSGGKIIFAGNGGSAAMASHCSVDLTKAAGIRAINFNEADLITCFANDYGYENWLKAAIKYYVKPKDLVVLLSVSGKSKNLVNAANFCKKKKIKFITMTGAKKNNPLSQKGIINYWIDSKAYNIVETLQMAILASIVDRIIGKSEYSSNL